MEKTFNIVEYFKEDLTELSYVILHFLNGNDTYNDFIKSLVNETILEENLKNEFNT